MKLKNKKTGEIEEFEDITRVFKFIGNQNTYSSLAELNEEWEDYEEPKEYWRITDLGEIKSIRLDQHHQNIKKCKEIGNYFETKEEAEKAVERLRAWKRLKDKGFRFERWCFSNPIDEAKIIIKGNCVPDTVEELDLLFGGEE